MPTEAEYEALSDRYADPSQPLPSPVEPPLTGAAATAAGHAFLLREYGSEQAVEQLLRRGRRRTGDPRQGFSPVVRARVSEQDYAAIERITAETGQTQAEVVRQAVRAFLAN